MGRRGWHRQVWKEVRGNVTGIAAVGQARRSPPGTAFLRDLVEPVGLVSTITGASLPIWCSTSADAASAGASRRASRAAAAEVVHQVVRAACIETNDMSIATARTGRTA